MKPTNDNPVHTGTLDGKQVITTWAPTKAEADRIAEELRQDGALFTRIFSRGNFIDKYRIIGHW